MKRALIFVITGVVIAGLAYYAFTHQNIERVEHLKGELAKLEAQNQALANENEKLEETIAALKDDPRLAERRARASGMARSTEVIYQFEEPEAPTPVQALLKVGIDSCELAGKVVPYAELSQALDNLKAQVPGAKLKVSFDEHVDALQRQHVRDAIEVSSFKSANFEED
jgi:cell division protein FtsB